jgi:hypothetical protein
MPRHLVDRPLQVEFDGQLYTNIPQNILENDALLLQLLQTANANAAGGTVVRSDGKITIKPTVKRNG